MTEPEYTGKDVSYYLVDIKTPKRLAPYKAECEDIIEALGMTFAEGCAFKAIWRKCAARTLGAAKAGYKGGLYDAEKTQYYGGRMVAAEERNLVSDQCAAVSGVATAALTSALSEFGAEPTDAATGYQQIVAAAQAGITKRDCPECGAKSPGPHNDGCVYKDPVTSTPTESVCEDCHREPYQNHLPGCPRGEFQAEPEVLPAATVPVCPGCGRKEGHRHRRGCTTRWPELAESAPKDDPFAGAPDWAKYKAQDESGSYYWFECAPMMALSGWTTTSGLSAFSGNGSPNPNWRETRIERPTK
jgi:hypothetical protein